MGAYVELKVRFRYSDETPDIVNKLHNIYKAYRMKPIDMKTYEQDCKTNQECFDKRIEFDEWQHSRISWKSDWISFVETMPIIEVINSAEGSVPYDKIKAEGILFPEEDMNDEAFAIMLSLISDLYRLDEVYSVSIIKEE